jgi:hypothetical protein
MASSGCMTFLIASAGLLRQMFTLSETLIAEGIAWIDQAGLILRQIFTLSETLIAEG